MQNVFTLQQSCSVIVLNAYDLVSFVTAVEPVVDSNEVSAPHYLFRCVYYFLLNTVKIL